MRSLGFPSDYNDDEALCEAETGLVWDCTGGSVFGPGRRTPEVLAAMPYRMYLRTPEWQQTRLRKADAANYRCDRCRWRHPKDERGLLAGLNIHHVSYDRIGCENLDDLECLCRSCHALEHGKPAIPNRYPERAGCEACGGSGWVETDGTVVAVVGCSWCRR